MKISEAIKHKGNPFWIPDCTRNELPEFFKSLGFKKGVEIGVSWAHNIIDYCEAGLQIDGIDPWKESRDNVYRKIISIPGEYAKTIDDVYKLACARTKKYPNCRLVRKMSEEAIDDYPDRSLDFVYIDGNHGFGYVAMDLMLWTRKVKKHGIIAGHDYYHYHTLPEGHIKTAQDRIYRHVKYVVDAYASCYDYDSYYILGSQRPKEGEKFDKALSYFLIKHW